ncbi:MAG TPA: 6-phosphogluconolactonase [Candidatus Binatia bacterium]
MSRAEKIVCRDLADLSRRAAAEFVRVTRGAAARSGRSAVALSGGSTPKALYALLAGPEFSPQIPWSEVHFFWGDERAVPPDHPDSNYRMAYETLLSKAPVPPENIHRIEAERPPEAAAAAYEQTIREFFRLAATDWPRFDLILLGLGDDGHTASLFPDNPALSEERRLAVATYVEKLGAHRITLTLPVLNHAANVFFLAAGKSKAAVLADVLRPGPGERLPAGRVDPADGRLVWFMDQAAAAFLPV